MKKLTIFLGTIFLLVSILGIYLSLKLPNFNNAVMFSMKPSFYPMIIFSLLFLSCIALIIKNLFANINEESKLHLINKDMRIMFGLYFLYILMLPFLQFIISTIIFLPSITDSCLPYPVILLITISTQFLTIYK